MKSGTTFLLAARQCEIAELEQLAQTSELVGLVGRYTHALQRERGLSNAFLASAGSRFASVRLEQIGDCESLEEEVRAALDQLDTDPAQARNGSRLFSRIAVVLYGLDGLPDLRARVTRHQLSPRDSTAAYVKLITGLLAVVFEAADTASDPEVSRALVALFNFMQGKEFAGQERAFGAAVFAAGSVDTADQQAWQHLVESQAASFRVFADFAGATVAAADHASQDPQVLAELERLRRIGCTLGALDTELSLRWFDTCSRRIDAMKTVEDLLAVHLRQLCDARIVRARNELADQKLALASFSRQEGGRGGQPASFGPHLERDIVGMVQAQSQRLQAMSDELETVRASLNERKLIERAKGLLMAHRQMSEDDAYKTLRQMAMNQNRRIVEVAQAVLALAEVLPATVR